MTTTNDKELRELDAWIAEHVMGKSIKHAASAKSDDYWWNAYGGESGGCVMRGMECFAPTEKPSDAMAVLKKCVAENYDYGVEIEPCSGNEFLVAGMKDEKYISAKAPTLELAICRFAQKLFTD